MPKTPRPIFPVKTETMTNKQPSLPLMTLPEAMGREDYILAPCNQVAFSLIEEWPGRLAAAKAALIGPESAGKTHLTHIWANRTGARILQSGDLVAIDVPEVAVAGPVAVEDVPAIAGNRVAEEALFHLHNMVLAEGNALLVTGRDAPSRWPLDLPDLASRMQSCAAVSLLAPDDDLLSALFVKFFADRQILPSPDVIAFLLPRIERSFSAAQRVAAALDATSLEEKRPVTRSMASRVLDRLEAGEEIR